MQNSNACSLLVLRCFLQREKLNKKHDWVMIFGSLDIYCDVFLIFVFHDRDVGQEKTKVRIGIATFDSTIHFYNLKVGDDDYTMNFFYMK